MRNRSSRVSARRKSIWLHGAFALTSVVALGGCSAPPGTGLDENDGEDVPEYLGPLPGVGGTPQPVQPGVGTATPPGSAASGATGSPSANGSPPPPAAAGNGNGNGNGNEQNGANAAPLTPNTPSPAANGSANGMNQGAAGSSMVAPAPGNQGAGGASMGGNEPDSDGDTDPVAPPPVAPPPVAPPPVAPPVTPPQVMPQRPDGPDTVCPASASFCAGFEGDGFPMGSQFEPSDIAAGAFGAQMRLDDTVANSGNQSLHLPIGANFYRMLSVPVPANDFWIRLYTRSDVGFGADGSTHAAIFMGSIVEPGGNYNADRAVEIAEQHDQVLLNVKDTLFGTSGTNPSGQPGTTLSDDTWTCMEARFNGNTGNINVYVEGDEIINATGWQPPMTFRSFRFGYLRYTSPARNVWVDDVVVGTSRVGCL